MIFGGVEREHLQPNEGMLWAGGPDHPDNTNAWSRCSKCGGSSANPA